MAMKIGAGLVLFSLLMAFTLGAAFASEKINSDSNNITKNASENNITNMTKNATINAAKNMTINATENMTANTNNTNPYGMNKGASAASAVTTTDAVASTMDAVQH